MSQSLQLPLERFNHWLHRQPDAIWLRQPVEGVWHDYSWRQVDEQARRLASALLALGCVPGERVALLAKNCAEWFISDLAIQHAGLISVPLYPLQAPEQIAYVLEHAGCKVILVGKLDEPDKLATGIAAHITRIAMPYPTMPAEHQWQALLAAHEPLFGGHLQRGEDLLSILYTSGTTGQLKGVMLSAHAMAFSAAHATAELNMTPQISSFPTCRCRMPPSAFWSNSTASTAAHRWPLSSRWRPSPGASHCVLLGATVVDALSAGRAGEIAGAQAREPAAYPAAGAAGCTPVTAASWTRRATCASPGGSRTSSRPARANTSRQRPSRARSPRLIGSNRCA